MAPIFTEHAQRNAGNTLSGRGFAGKNVRYPSGAEQGTPWEVIGAPYIHDVKLAYELNQAGLPGVRFLPVRFTPADSVFKGRNPAGRVNILIAHRHPIIAMWLDMGITSWEGVEPTLSGAVQRR